MTKTKAKAKAKKIENKNGKQANQRMSNELERVEGWNQTAKNDKKKTEKHKKNCRLLIYIEAHEAHLFCCLLLSKQQVTVLLFTMCVTEALSGVVANIKSQ